MTINEIIKAVISGVIAFTVPVFLKKLLPEPEKVTTLPWLKWCVAGFIGGVLGAVASFFIGPEGKGFGNWAAYGTAIGLFQWLALRGYRKVGTWFVLASMIGWIFAMIGGYLGLIAVGIAVGLLQYMGLTKYKGAFWWIIFNPIAWFVSGSICLQLHGALINTHLILGTLLEFGLGGLLGTAILLFPLSRLAGEKQSPVKPG